MSAEFPRQLLERMVLKETRTAIITSIDKFLKYDCQLAIPGTDGELINVLVTSIKNSLIGKEIYSPETVEMINNLSLTKLKTLKLGIDNLNIALEDKNLAYRETHLKRIAFLLNKYWYYGTLNARTDYNTEQNIGLGYDLRNYWKHVDLHRIGNVAGYEKI